MGTGDSVYSGPRMKYGSFIIRTLSASRVRQPAIKVTSSLRNQPRRVVKRR